MHQADSNEMLGWPLKFLRILYFAVSSIRTNQVPVRASALTYTTLLAAIPFVILLSLFAGKFGYLALLSSVLPQLQNSLGVELPLTEIQALIEHAQSIELGGLGVMGSLFLFVSFVLAMTNLEKGMNIIWGVKIHRSIFKRILMYIPFLLFVIIFILLISWMLVMLKSYLDWMIIGATGYRMEMVSFSGFMLGLFGMLWVFLVVLYLMVPYTNVRLKSAVIGASFATGILAGFGYIIIHFQSLMFTRYSVMYGSLAIFPLLMVLMYSAWVIVLTGVALTYGHQRSLERPHEDIQNEPFGASTP